MGDKTPDHDPNGRSSRWLLLWFVLMVAFTAPFLEFGPFALIIPIPAVLAAGAMLGIRWTWDAKWPCYFKILATLAIPVLICGLGWLLMRAFFSGTKTLFF